MAAISNTRIEDLSGCVRALNAISDPVAKFEAFDQITSNGLRSPAFCVLQNTTSGPGFYPYSKSTDLNLGPLGPTYIQTVQDAVKNCKKLSDATIKSLSPTEKNRLSSICPKIDTYIDSKIFHVLMKIFQNKNFAGSNHPNHPLHSLNEEMWEYQSYNHGIFCSCFTRINNSLTLPAENKSSPNHQTALITVKCDVGLGNKLFIRGNGPGLTWDQGVELKNIGTDSWAFESRADFPSFEYKILLNDRVWEPGDNHKIDCGKKEEIRPRF